MMRSLLSIVQAADNFPAHPHSPYPTHSPDGSERYVPFHLTFADYQAGLTPVGLLRPVVLQLLQDEESGAPPGEAGEGSSTSSPWQFYSTATASSSASSPAPKGAVGTADEDENMDELELQVQCVFLADWAIEAGGKEIGRTLQEIAEKWKKDGLFKKQLDGWRDERYQIYASSQSTYFAQHPSTSSGPFSNAVFSLERAACALFGLATFGVHMTAYEGEEGDMKLWIPRRSATKPTYPGMLDNTVAGGIPAGISPLETMIKECAEEASLPEAFVRPRLKAAGVITYFHLTSDGWLQPELEYIYDLPLPPSYSEDYIRPKPFDDEVESFALLTVPETLAAMHAGEFKPNCGSVIVDFMIRHGMVTPETEPNYLAIRWSLGRRLGVSVPGL